MRNTGAGRAALPGGPCRRRCGRERACAAVRAAAVEGRGRAQQQYSGEDRCDKRSELQEWKEAGSADAASHRPLLQYVPATANGASISATAAGVGATC